MRAIVVKALGDLSVLELTEASHPAADENTAVVEVRRGLDRPQPCQERRGAR
jgi:hypothetical protein